MIQNLPAVEASPELRAELKLFFKKTSSFDRLLKLIEVDSTKHLLPSANVFQAEVIGARLARAASPRQAHGIYTDAMLESKWNASFSENRAPEYPLGVHCAYDFALCLESLYRDSKAEQHSVQDFLSYLEDRYPLTGRGIFDVDDIS